MDVRVRVTKKIIRDAFFSILKEKSASKITVRELCEKADINRSTFYKYYDDPFDLLKKTEDEVIDTLQEQIIREGGGTLDGIFAVILNDIYARKDIYLPLFEQSGGQVFRRRIFALLYDDNNKVINHFFPDAPEHRKKWLFYFIGNGCTSVLDQWIAGGMTQPTEEVVVFLTGLINTINNNAQIS